LLVIRVFDCFAHNGFAFKKIFAVVIVFPEYNGATLYVLNITPETIVAIMQNLRPLFAAVKFMKN